MSKLQESILSGVNYADLVTNFLERVFKLFTQKIEFTPADQFHLYTKIESDLCELRKYFGEIHSSFVEEYEEIPEKDRLNVESKILNDKITCISSCIVEVDKMSEYVSNAIREFSLKMCQHLT